MGVENKILIALVLLVSACGDGQNITRLDVHCSFDLALQIDQLRFSVLDGQSVIVNPTTRPDSEGSPLSLPQGVVILLSDARAGQSLVVHVDGLHSGAVVATGNAPALPVQGKNSDVMVTLMQNNVTLQSIQVSAPNATLSILPPDDSQQYSAKGVYSDGSTQDLTVGATWNSSDSSVASVGNTTGSKGLAMAITPGMTEISATYMTITGMAALSVQ